MENFFCISLVGGNTYYNGNINTASWSDTRFREYKNYAAAHNDAAMLSRYYSVQIKRVSSIPNGKRRVDVMKVFPKKAKMPDPFAF